MADVVAIVDQLYAAGHYTVVYAGLTVFILGVIGNILNIVVFSSLKTFRRNPCAFCLLVFSVVCCGTLLLNLLSFILYRGFNYNTTVTSVAWCKIQTAFAQAFHLIALSCMCLAATDQCLSTTVHGRHKGISLHLMRRLISVAAIVWSLHSVPTLVYWTIEQLPGGNRMCMASLREVAFLRYLTYVYLPALNGLLPVSIMGVLALVAFRNVRSIASRQVHIVRLRLEQQLTAMVLLKIGFLTITIVPFNIVYIIQILTSASTDPVEFAKQQLALVIFTLVFFVTYADGFYIFLASSARFRRQLKHVLVDIHLKSCRSKREVNPISQEMISVKNSIGASL